MLEAFKANVFPVDSFILLKYFADIESNSLTSACFLLETRVQRGPSARSSVRRAEKTPLRGVLECAGTTRSMRQGYMSAYVAAKRRGPPGARATRGRRLNARRKRRHPPGGQGARAKKRLRPLAEWRARCGPCLFNLKQCSAIIKTCVSLASFHTRRHFQR